MTQEPPQSWPRREPSRSGTRPLEVDPLTGELIESDSPPGGEFWGPPVPEPGGSAGPPAAENAAPNLVKGPPAAGMAQPDVWTGSPGNPAADPPPGHGAPGCGAPGYGAPGYPPVAPQAGYLAPGYPPPAYGPPAHGYPAPGWPPPHGAGPYAAPYGGARVRATNGMAIASLVLGAVWMFWIGSVLALVFGYIARNQIRRSGEGGDGLAVAGLVLGWVGVGFLTLAIVAGVLDGS